MAGRVPGLTHAADLESALRQATNRILLEKRTVLNCDDVFLALLVAPGPAKDALVSLGKDPSEMRARMMQSGPSPSD